MDNKVITSKQNERVKELVKLREKKLVREEVGQFLIEGHKEVNAALESPVKVIELYFCTDYFSVGEFGSLLNKAKAKGVQLIEVNRGVFEKISHREGPDGFLAIGETWARRFEDIKLSSAPLIVVVERVEKPGNLGNLMRSTEAAGADLMVVTDPVVDIFNPNVVRASRGAVFSLPIVVADNEATERFMREKKIVPVAFSPHGRGEYWDANMKGPTAIMCGSEFEGLSPFWMNHPLAQVVKIPMHMQGDSLNVATAAALGLYEALRQRR